MGQPIVEHVMALLEILTPIEESFNPLSKGATKRLKKIKIKLTYHREKIEEKREKQKSLMNILNVLWVLE